MKSLPHTLAAVAALVMLVPGGVLRAQNPIPNSPPSMAPHNPALQPASAAAPAKEAADAVAAPPAGASSAGPVAATVSNDYVLAPSDTLEMSVFNEPTLTTPTRIGADGTVQFPLIGEVKVAGLTVRDARELIRRKYNADYLVEPQVYLNVTAYAQRRFTVLGQVNRPGTYEFPGGESLGLLEAVGLAGGFTRLASTTVEIKRHDGGNDRTFKINTKKLDARGAKPFSLAPGDVVTVPETWF